MELRIFRILSLEMVKLVLQIQSSTAGSCFSLILISTAVQFNFKIARITGGKVDFHYSVFGDSEIMFERTEFGNSRVDFRTVDFGAGE